MCLGCYGFKVSPTFHPKFSLLTSLDVLLLLGFFVYFWLCFFVCVVFWGEVGHGSAGGLVGCFGGLFGAFFFTVIHKSHTNL